MLAEKYKETLALLISEELNSGKVFRFTISTPSMLPLIKPEDKIIVRKDSLDTLRCGDIVVFEKYRDLYTHRLLCKKISSPKIELITKGDNSLVIDEPVSGDELLGKVIRIERGTKCIDLESKFWKIVNGLVRTLSYLEWIAFNSLRNLKKLILKL
jgi:signal peptidase I